MDLSAIVCRRIQAPRAQFVSTLVSSRCKRSVKFARTMLPASATRMASSVAVAKVLPANIVKHK